ncbi:HFL265Cp [Eremothecium sinecaudum]|uniref:HFL265Cp n=1 Tax=Eremothecium sinecaudum TaxID=45286 RepID=A0A0X8HUA8_9SACH|nr:HFL265Cp [Eremothecium sinecaudum]AMD21591.1 HFL265Cp [Eremothecium sinecaudum]
MTEQEDLHLYHLTLQRQANYVHSCVGHFVNYKEHDLLVGSKVEGNGSGKTGKSRKDLQLCLATQTHIDLFDVEDGRLERVVSVPIFANIMSMDRLKIENNTYLLIASDSGNLTVCEFVFRDGIVKLKTLFNEPMSRSGVRRLSPHSYLAVNPQGRCMMVAGMERNKLCYLTDVKQNELCISSPLEVNRPNFVCMAMEACDVGYDNPMFAALEISLDDKSRHLIFYMLDLGLNHVVRKAEFALRDQSASFLLAIPNLEPYGIAKPAISPEEGDPDAIIAYAIVGFDNYISLRDESGRCDISVQLPSRKDAQKTQITCGTVHKLKKEFFVLLQSNFGDLYKVKIIPDAKEKFPVITISYFDTIPQAQGLHIFKNGFLYSNSEFSNHYLYQFEKLGDDAEEDTLSSYMPGKRLIFKPRLELDNLAVADYQDLLNPIVGAHFLNILPLSAIIESTDGTKLLKAGVSFDAIISSPLPQAPLDIWTTKANTSAFHKLLFIGLAGLTMILKTADGTIEELELDSNPFILKNDKTLLVACMGRSSIIQVCENRLIQVIEHQNDEYESKLEWLPPAGISITKAAANSSQLVLSLSNNEIVYFEVGMNDSLNELQDRIELEDPVTDLSVAYGHRSEFLAVACNDASVRVYSLKSNDTENFLEVVSMQALMSVACSVQLLDSNVNLSLHIGLNSGVYVRSKLDKVNGQLFDVRTKFIGSKPVTITSLPNLDPLVNDNENEDDEEEADEVNVHRAEDSEKGTMIHSVMLHSSRTWISYELGTEMFVRPMIITDNQVLKAAAPFASTELLKNGCCSINSNGSLVVGKIGKLSSCDSWFQFTDVSVPIPNGSTFEKRLEGHKTESYQSGTNQGKAEGEEEQKEEKEEREIEGDEEQEDEAEDEDEEDDYDLVEKKQKSNMIRGRTVLADPDDDRLLYIFGNYTDRNCSIMSVFKNDMYYSHNITNKTFQIFEDCKIISVQIARFGQDTKYIVLSTQAGTLKTFRLHIYKRNQQRLFDTIHIHDTVVGNTVHALVAFDDKILVHANSALILYGMGKKQLLKKSLTPTSSSIKKVVALDQWKNDRIAVADIHESVTLYIYDKKKNIFTAIADDITKRHVTCIKFLDESTIIGGDRFSNVWVLRLPQEFNKILKEDLEGYIQTLTTNLPSNIREAIFKWKLTNHFYVNDIPMSFQIISSTLLSDRDVIYYTGLQGTVGCFIPLITRKEVEVFESIDGTMKDADYIFYREQEDRRRDDFAEGLDDNEADSGNLDSHFQVKKEHRLPEGAYSLVGRDILAYRSYYNPVRHVIDGDLCERYTTLSTRERNFLSEKIGSSVQEIHKYINNMRTNCL